MALKYKGAILTKMTGEKSPRHEESSDMICESSRQGGVVYVMTTVFAHIPHLFPTMNSFVPFGPLGHGRSFIDE